jgi:hypothetical protein
MNTSTSEIPGITYISEPALTLHSAPKICRCGCPAIVNLTVTYLAGEPPEKHTAQLPLCMSCFDKMMPGHGAV